jgi:hypothetical protein
MKHRPPPDPCPNCDAEVPRNARACPGCGADWTTGWNEDGDDAGGLDLPEDDFDYDEFVQREFDASGRVRPKPANKPWVVLTALGLLVLIVFAWIVLR